MVPRAAATESAVTGVPLSSASRESSVTVTRYVPFSGASAMVRCTKATRSRAWVWLAPP